MILEIKEPAVKVELKYKTKSIVKITNELENKNFEELYFNVTSENNVEALCKIIMAFAVNEDNGLQYFKNIDEVYEFLDVYMAENKKTYKEIFSMIAEDINKQGFFNSKMTLEELHQKINSHIAMDLNKIIKESAEKAIVQVAQDEMQFHKG